MQKPYMSFCCCSICQKTFKNLVELESHAKDQLHSGAKLQRFETMTCKICPEAPAAPLHLILDHIRSVHQVEDNFDLLVEKVVVTQVFFIVFWSF
jgi:hypothetical protein